MITFVWRAWSFLSARHVSFPAELHSSRNLSTPRPGVFFRLERLSNRYEAESKQIRSRYEAEFEQFLWLSRRRPPDRGAAFENKFERKKIQMHTLTLKNERIDHND